MKKIKVLFVCLGNICRSPMAAAIFRHKIEANGMAKWVESDSCGTSDYHIGDAADRRTVSMVSRNGIDIQHCVRQFSSVDFENFDFIFAMDKSNYHNILKFENGKDPGHKVQLMRNFDPVGKGGEVPDPYHGGEADFQEVYEILDRSTSEFIAYLQKEYGHQH